MSSKCVCFIFEELSRERELDSNSLRLFMAGNRVHKEVIVRVMCVHASLLVTKGRERVQKCAGNEKARLRELDNR